MPTWSSSLRRRSSPRSGRTRSSRCTRWAASASCSSACTRASRRSTTCACAAPCSTPSIGRRSSRTSWKGSAAPARGVLAPGVFGYKDMELDRLYPFDKAKAKALLTQAGWTPGPGRHHAEGRPAAVALLARRARPLSEGRRDHRGGAGHAEGRGHRGQGAVPRVGGGLPAGAGGHAQPQPVHARLGDVERGRGLLALRAVPLEAGAARRMEHVALREPEGRHARRAGAPEPQPDGAREALRRGAGHPRQGDGVDPRLHHEGDHRDARPP